MNVFVGVVLLSVLIEKLGEVLKAVISPVKLPAWGWFSITSAMGVLLCILFKIDIFTELGFAANSTAAVIVGQLFTGIAAGSGSNFMHDLIKRLKLGKTMALQKAVSETAERKTASENFEQQASSDIKGKKTTSETVEQKAALETTETKR
jgi:uncharacterized membrane protein YdcZ (DUF606 family)